MKLDGFESKLLYKLYRNRCFGKGHMLESNLLSGFPKHTTGEAKAALKALKRSGIVLTYPTKHGFSVYIEAGKRLDVFQALKRDYPWLSEF